MTTHELFIKRCIDIAQNGLGYTRPNPMVGAVVVFNNKIIGEGYTSAYGGAHAEVNAINSVKDKSLLQHATLYVTLEPCSHHGKTPPCSDLIIKHNIPNVVIGCIDDNELVAGKGIKKLINAGTNVTVSVLEKQCKALHKRFFTFHNKKRPFIILKWAETANGFIAPETKALKKPVWITNTFSRQLVHKWRTEEHAILVGTNTVLEDNPSLTARRWKGNNPIRIVIDRTNKASKNANIFNSEAKTLVINDKNTNYSKKIAAQICNNLFEKNINSLIIEGGAKTLQTFIDENLWDEARIFKGHSKFQSGINAPIIQDKKIALQKNILDDILTIYTND